MLLTGLEEVELGIMNSNDDETIDPKKIFTLNAATGGPTEFQIQGLSPELSKVFGGDAARRSTGRGTGNINGSFNVDDFPSNVLHPILGMVQDSTDKTWSVDSTTEAPYVSVKIKSHGGDGKAIWMILTKVKFARGDINPKTNTETQQDSSDALTYTGNVRNSDGKPYIEGLESEGVTEAAIFKKAFGIDKSTTTTTTKAVTTTTTKAN